MPFALEGEARLGPRRLGLLVAEALLVKAVAKLELGAAAQLRVQQAAILDDEQA